MDLALRFCPDAAPPDGAVPLFGGILVPVARAWPDPPHVIRRLAISQHERRL